MGAQRCDPMRRRGRRSERGAWQVADIKVALELRPGPSISLVVDGDAFAVQRLGLQRRIRVRRSLSGALAAMMRMRRPST